MRHVWLSFRSKQTKKKPSVLVSLLWSLSFFLHKFVGVTVYQAIGREFTPRPVLTNTFTKQWSECILLGGKTAVPGIASSIPLTPTKITKRRCVLVPSRKKVYWFFLRKKCSLNALHWARLRTWFAMCGRRSSILHYGPLTETNNMCVPKPND